MHPTEEEVGSVIPLGGIVEQVLDAKNSVPVSTDRGYNSGLLIAKATVKRFDKQWSILIDSEGSCNYSRRHSLA